MTSRTIFLFALLLHSIGAATLPLTTNTFVEQSAFICDGYLAELKAQEPDHHESLIEIQVSPYKRYQLVAKLFTKIEQTAPALQYTRGIDTTTLDDLTLITGHERTARNSIANAVSNTKTAFGQRVRHRDLIAAASGNIPTDEYFVRQRATATLALDNTLFASLSDARNNCARGEKTLLSLWSANRFRDSLVYPQQSSFDSLDKIYTVFATNPKLKTATTLFNRWNKGTFGKVPFGEGAVKVGVVAGPPLISAALSVAVAYGLLKNGPKATLTDAAKLSKGLFKKSGYVVKNPRMMLNFLKAVAESLSKILEEKIPHERLRQAIVGSIFLGVTGYSAYHLYNNIKTIKSNKRDFSELQSMLRRLELFFKGAEACGFAVEKTPELKSLLELYPFASFDAVINQRSTVYQKLAEIRTLLNGSGVQKDSYYLVPAGQGYVALYKLIELKNQLLPLMAAVGIVDSYTGAAELTIAHSASQEKNGFCLINLSRDEHPRFEAQGLWNVMVDPEKAVVSNFALGGDNAAKSATLSGVNAGGKSTFLRAVMSAAILSVLGIAPARSLTMTPFTHFGTYANIVDNVAKNESLFMVEVRRATELLQLVNSLKEGDRMLLMADEIFRGTEGTVSASLSQAVADYIASNPHCMMLLASHHPETTLLEKETNGRIKNFHVKANVEEKRITYPYRLFEGPTHQNVAFDMIEQSGSNLGDIVSKARAIHDNLVTKYSARLAH